MIWLPQSKNRLVPPNAHFVCMRVRMRVGKKPKKKKKKENHVLHEVLTTLILSPTLYSTILNIL